MGAGRSLQALLDHYLHQRDTGEPPKKPPTTSLDTLKKWSLHNRWQERVQAWDEDQQRQRADHMAQRRAELLEHEWTDYLALKAEYAEAVKRIPLHRQRKKAVLKDEGTGQEREVITVEMAVNDWVNLARWRNEIADLGRKAVGLPPDNKAVRIGNIEGEAFKVDQPGLIDLMAEVFRELDAYQQQTGEEDGLNES